MSGILKSIGKVFRKIVKSKIFKVIAVAAAVYFTAGIALGAAGVGFAATLPGIQAAAGAIGLGGTGAFAAATAATTAGAAAASVGLGGALAGEAGAGAVGAIGAMEAEVAGGIAGSITGSVAPAAATGLSLSNVASGVSLANTGLGMLKPQEEAGADAGGGSDPTDVKKPQSSTPTITNGGKTEGSSLMKYFNANPAAAQAALTFGAGTLQAGANLFAAKSQQDSADARANQDRIDRQNREQTPTLTNPATKYNTGLVNSVADTNPVVKP